MPEIPEEYQYLAWFLGPKAENRKVFEEALTFILQDYVHWRVNYFPDDDTLITRDMERQFERQSDAMHENVHRMAAGLRRNFPFYSPRYMGHMLSDVTMPSLLGYFAGMLYNPNNVATEAAPVTMEWEIDACNRLLQMFGFRPAPRPMKGEPEDSFAKRLPREFGWSHITFDGTTANIESLWVARTVKYLPVAVLDVAMQYGLQIELLLQHAPEWVNKGRGVGLGVLLEAERRIAERRLLLMKPSDCLALLDEYLRSAVQSSAIRGSLGIPEPSKAAWEALRRSQYNITTGGTAELFSRHPPSVFVTGAGHYSLAKCTDLLGLGNVSFIQMDENLRLNPENLRECVETCLRNGGIPLAVVAIVGTTEEGAVDPVHKILKLREEFESCSEESASFWIHVDAAWGGFIRSLFNVSDREAVETMLSKIGKVFGIEDLVTLPQTEAVRYHNLLRLSELIPHKNVLVQVVNRLNELRDLHIQEEYERLREELSSITTWAKGLDIDGDYIRRSISTIPQSDEGQNARRELMEGVDELLFLEVFLEGEDLADADQSDVYRKVREFVSAEATLSRGTYHGAENISWHDKDVYDSFISLSNVDSVVCDPQKMGYTVYPCGVVLFKDNRVRKYIRREAPYITMMDLTSATNLPPRYPKTDADGKTSVHVEAFGPFILEGSRPGAAASSLSLSLKSIPPTREAHGSIVRASLLAARELYLWLERWESISLEIDDPTPFSFVSLTPNGPDTNVVTFVVVRKGFGTLEKTNELTMAVYRRLSIQTELGERQHSYSQPFFISHTRATEQRYPYGCLRNFFSRAGLQMVNEQDYRTFGLGMLRASVMSPYLYATARLTKDNLVRQFVEKLAEIATAEL